MDKLNNIAETVKPSPEQITKIRGFLTANAKYIIGGIVIFCVLMFILVGYNRSQETKKTFPMLIDHPRDATKPYFIRSSTEEDKKVPDMSMGEATLGVWVYLKEVTPNTHNHHIVSVGKMPESDDSNETFKSNIKIAFFDDNSENPNNVQIYVKHSDKPTPDSNPSEVHESCHLARIPVKKWCHILVSVWNQNVDVYLNGKLARSCVLEGIPEITPDANDIVVTSPNVDRMDSGNTDSGFKGYLSRLSVSNRSISPDKAYQIYLKGPYSGSWWSKTSNKDPTTEEDSKCNTVTN